MREGSALVVSIIKRILICVVAVLMMFGLVCCLKKKKVPEPEMKEEIIVVEDPNEPKEDMIPRPNLQPKLKEAQEKYKDAVAWVHIPDAVDFAVMLCPKDSGRDDGRNRYYRHAEDGSWRLSGSVTTFPTTVFDSREKLSRNLVLTGHHVEGHKQEMFGPLEQFYKLSFAQNHPYAFLAIPGEDLVFEIFAVFVAEVPYRKYNEGKGFGYYFSEPPGSNPDAAKGGDGSLPPVMLSGDKSWIQVIAEEAKKRSFYVYDGTKIKKDDKIITFSTCTYIFGPTSSENCKAIELVIQGRLLEPERKLRAEALVCKNQNPKLPKLPKPSDAKYEAQD